MEIYHIINLLLIIIVAGLILYFLSKSLKYFLNLSNLEFMRIRDDLIELENDKNKQVVDD
jgi:hypothetical protein